jgi:hypothetical protein
MEHRAGRGAGRDVTGGTDGTGALPGIGVWQEDGGIVGTASGR